jgi:hypothetical protein
MLAAIPGRRLALLLGLLIFTGCNKDNRGAVSGQVTLDGVPLESGSIAFIPIEGTASPSAGATVEKGAYAIPVALGPMPGNFRVEIHSPKKTGKKSLASSPAPPNTWIEESIEAVPEKYNKQSKLRAEVKPGSNTFDFELKNP